LLEKMYAMDDEGAYRVLVSELPFDLGPYVTPLVIADDAKAMEFMSQGCCQTYKPVSSEDLEGQYGS
jgi:hypothetical protein